MLISKILIVQSVSERQCAKMNDDRQIADFAIFALLNSEVTAPIFIKISHNVDALDLV